MLTKIVHTQFFDSFHKIKLPIPNNFVADYFGYPSYIKLDYQKYENVHQFSNIIYLEITLFISLKKNPNDYHLQFYINFFMWIKHHPAVLTFNTCWICLVLWASPIIVLFDDNYFTCFPNFLSHFILLFNIMTLLLREHYYVGDPA